MIRITKDECITQNEVINMVKDVINKGKFSGAFQSETFFKYPSHTFKVVSWNDGEQTDYFHLTLKRHK
tara:strand:- start:10736 stop:10939 length:204 start_codon:yes stop_codon:yes gene_type:complete